jgi:type I restriction enzyme R subunit
VSSPETLSLTDGIDDPLVGPQGSGRCKQNEEPLEALPTLINALNGRFGIDLGDGDRIWFEQQESVLRNDEDVRVVALSNSFQQLDVYLGPKIRDRIVERHGTAIGPAHEDDDGFLRTYS